LSNHNAKGWAVLLTIPAPSWYHSPAKNQPRAGWYHKQEKIISAIEFRVNENIRVPEVRLIGPNGENIGVVAIKQALQIARDAEMDLVEVSPTATPPVCRVTDFGKFIYERTKKEREARRSQTKIEVKEIRLRPKTNEAHRGFKVDDARRWLLQGHKVRVTIKFRGREMDYPEIALEDLKEIAASLADVSTIEQAPMMEGRTMLVVLAPGKPSVKKKEKAETPAEASS
jgi:translation initiation factor IF-3